MSYIFAFSRFAVSRHVGTRTRFMSPACRIYHVAKTVFLGDSAVLERL